MPSEISTNTKGTKQDDIELERRSRDAEWRRKQSTQPKDKKCAGHLEKERSRKGYQFKLLN